MKKTILLVAMLAFGASNVTGQTFPFPANSWAERDEALESLETGMGEVYAPHVKSGFKPLAEGEHRCGFETSPLVRMHVFGGVRWVIGSTESEAYVCDENGNVLRMWVCGNGVDEVFIPVYSFRRPSTPVRRDTLVVVTVVQVVPLREALFTGWNPTPLPAPHFAFSKPPRKSWIVRSLDEIGIGLGVVGTVLGIVALATGRKAPPAITNNTFNVGGGSVTVNVNVIPPNQPPTDPPVGPSDGTVLPPSDPPPASDGGVSPPGKR